MIKELGAIGLYDFEMKANLNNWLSMEEAKGMLYVKERAHIAARYHQAVFYELAPRFWAINYGKDEDGKLDSSHWFNENWLPSLGLLVKEDEAGLRDADSHEQAVARRAVIFTIDEDLFDQGHQGATDAAAVAQWKMDMDYATPLD